jgi:hypothetical protein
MCSRRDRSSGWESRSQGTARSAAETPCSTRCSSAKSIVTQAEESVDRVGSWLFHVSPSANRASIRDGGLQPRASGGRGLLGPPTQDAPGIFVCEDREEAEWRADNLNPALVRVDIWRFPSHGVHLVPSDHGFLGVPGTPPKACALTVARVTPPQRTRGAGYLRPPSHDQATVRRDPRLAPSPTASSSGVSPFGSFATDEWLRSGATSIAPIVRSPYDRPTRSTRPHRSGIPCT